MYTIYIFFTSYYTLTHAVYIYIYVYKCVCVRLRRGETYNGKEINTGRIHETGHDSKDRKVETRVERKKKKTRVLPGRIKIKTEIKNNKNMAAPQSDLNNLSTCQPGRNKERRVFPFAVAACAWCVYSARAWFFPRFFFRVSFFTTIPPYY